MSATPAVSPAADEAGERQACDAWFKRERLDLPGLDEVARAWMWQGWKARAALSVPARAVGQEPERYPQLWEIDGVAYLGRMPAVGQEAPAGWRLVPVEPTYEMKLAASNAWKPAADGHYTARMDCGEEVWAAMLRNAPTPGQAVQQQEPALVGYFINTGAPGEPRWQEVNRSYRGDADVVRLYRLAAPQQPGDKPAVGEGR